MKHLIILLFITLAAALQAGEPAARHTFEGEITGVVCSVCSDHVKVALSKLPGVESVKVLHGDKAGVNKLIIVSTAEKITKEEANLALGDSAKTYAVTSLQPAKP